MPNLLIPSAVKAWVRVKYVGRDNQLSSADSTYLDHLCEQEKEVVCSATRVAKVVAESVLR